MFGVKPTYPKSTPVLPDELMRLRRVRFEVE